MLTPTELAALFQQFCIPAEHTTGPAKQAYKTPRLIWCLAGSDGTQTWENRMRQMLGEEAYECLHWDMIACDWRIFVMARRTKPPGVEPFPHTGSVPADIVNELHAIEERATSHSAYEIEITVPPSFGQDCSERVLGRLISAKYMALIRALPNARFCGPTTDTVTPVYFRFDGGVGCVMPLSES